MILTTPEVALARAEASFAAGDLNEARRLLHDGLSAGPDAATSAQLLGDLAVVAATEGSFDDAETFAAAALARVPDFLPALEVLAHCAQARSAPVEAAHWRRRAGAAAPDDAGVQAELAAALIERGDLVGARGAIEAAGAAAGSSPQQLEQRERFLSAVPSAGRRPSDRSALIVVDYFWPSVGGSERLAEDAAVSLRALGWRVEVATRALPERTELERDGIALNEIRPEHALDDLSAVVTRGRFGAVLAFSDPRAWPVPAALALPEPRPRIVAVPCVNAEVYAALESIPGLLQRHAALASTADSLVYSSYAGPDARLCQELGLAGTYVPNAVRKLSPEGDFRSDHDIPRDVPLLLVVGSRAPVKNHIGLLEVMGRHAGDWHLALVGGPYPGAPEVSAAIERAAAEDPRVTLVERATPGEVAGAMDAADLLLLPSFAEATPLVLLEAMRQRLPWLATPTCGSAIDHCGGVLLPVDRFPAAASLLLDRPDLGATLGDAGHTHFSRSYSWDVIGRRYEQLLAGNTVCPLTPPRDAFEATQAVASWVYDQLAADRAARYEEARTTS